MRTELGGKIEVTVNGTTYRLDFVIAGTGYSGDLSLRDPELRDFAGADPALGATATRRHGGTG